MKAISLWQPYASLIGRGKHIETRSWPTAYRGPIAIHAAKRWTGEEVDLCEEAPFSSCLDDFAQHTPEGIFTRFQLPLGAIVATATLWNCQRTEILKPQLERLGDTCELAFGNFAPGRWGWCFKDIHILETPIPYRGQQGLFDVPELDTVTA